MVAEEEQDYTTKLVDCPNCLMLMSKIETCNEVAITYEWDIKAQEYEEVDVNYCGEVTVSYYCYKCNISKAS